MQDEFGEPDRVLFGDLVALETCAKEEAVGNMRYSAFFNVRGDLKRGSVSHGHVPRSERPKHVRLPDEEADYTRQEGDRRRLVDRQIRERRGQRQFREALCRRYGNRCLVTGCEILSVLEAAHINPYRGENDNNPKNGLLLRADIHTLFDLDLLGIEPDRLQVELHPDLARDGDYRTFAGRSLGCEGGRRPSREELKVRYGEFRKGISRTE
jgi:hypothetical protein